MLKSPVQLQYIQVKAQLLFYCQPIYKPKPVTAVLQYCIRIFVLKARILNALNVTCSTQFLYALHV